MNKSFRISLCLTIAVMLFIFLQSTFPASLSSRESGVLVGLLTGLFHSDPERTVFLVRKTAHFLEYLVLGIGLQGTLYFRTSDGNGHGMPGLKYVPAAWLTGTFYAVSDELHQSLVPGRSAELRDVVIDSAGILTGIFLLIIIMMVKNKRGSSSE